MNQAQRVVLVIALGIATLLAVATVNLLLYEPFAAGWFAYAPNTGVTFSPSQTDDYFVVTRDWPIVRHSLIALAGLLVWSAASLRILRTPPGADES
jgi:hypothetical protein